MEETKIEKSWNRFKRNTDRVAGGVIGFGIGVFATILSITHNSTSNQTEEKTKNFYYGPYKAGSSFYYSTYKAGFTYVISSLRKDKIRFADIPLGNRLSVYAQNYVEHDFLLLSAVDYDKDGEFDLILKMTNTENKINQIANFDSVKAIYNKVENEYYEASADEDFKKHYNQLFEAASKTYMFPIDTLVRAKGGEKFGLTDILKDGDYDMIQYVGSTPGSYSITISDDYIEKASDKNGVAFVPSGFRVTKLNRKEFNKSLNYIMPK